MSESLQDLAQQARVRHDGASGRAMAEAAQREGYKIDRTALNHILAGTYSRRPQRATLEAIAWLADVKLDRVYAAANLRIPEGPFEVHQDADYLSPEEKRAVNNLIQAITAGRAELAETNILDLPKFGSGRKRAEMQRIPKKAARKDPDE